MASIKVSSPLCSLTEINIGESVLIFSFKASIDQFLSRSHLLIITSMGLPRTSLQTRSSLLSRGWERSKITRLRSAFSIATRVLFIPSFSIGSGILRSPAESIIFICTSLLGEYSYRTKNVYMSEPNPYFLLFLGYLMYLLSL